MNKCNPVISIVIPAYNCQQFIDETILSLSMQDYEDYEIIFIDDGSTDSTGDILDKYASENAKIKVYHTENQGQGAARNYGISLASGKYILFLDADDLYEKDFLKKMVSAAEKNETDITICCSLDINTKTKEKSNFCYSVNLDFCSVNKKFVARDISNHIFNFTIGWAWDKLYRLDFVKKNKLKFADLRHSEDLVFVYGAYCFNPSIVVLDDVLIYHRVANSNSVSNSRSNNPLLFIDAAKILEEIIHKTSMTYNFSQSYLNWVCEFFFWHLDTIDDKNKKLVLQNIRNYFASKNLYSYKKDFFYIPSLYERLHSWKGYVFEIKYLKNTKYIKLFGLTLLKISDKNQKTVFKLFGFIPVFKIFKNEDVKKYYLMGFLIWKTKGQNKFKNEKIKNEQG